VKRNPYFAKLGSNYLFQEIIKRKNKFLELNPQAQLISLGVGDTTLPLVSEVTQAIKNKAEALQTKEGYTGYPSLQGSLSLREAICEKFYKGIVEPDEIFLQDGAKPEIGRLQLFFGRETRLSLQDPTYPAYLDTALAVGYEKISYMKCLEENGFFGEIKEEVDLIYFCSPNNPTGAVATKKQLEALVKKAQEMGSFIVFDSAYASFIKDKELPRSIFEVEGGRSCALEVGSFSKLAGFTGVRLGWTVVPKDLKFETGESVIEEFKRLHATFFNGPSNLAESGALAVFSEAGYKKVMEGIDYYMENINLLKNSLEVLGYLCYGGENAPYLFVKVNKSSWEAFEEFLEKYQIVTTPGKGFGCCGEGFLRFSGFGKREDVLEAIRRLEKCRIL
jgi:LL-diaminopimelate aminotransferase